MLPFQIARVVTKYNNIISIIGAIALLLFILVTRLLKFKAAERLSYKIYIWIAISDIIYSTLVLAQTQKLIDRDAPEDIREVLEENMDFCILATHTQHIVNVWFVFLTTCLAYNLQTVFLKKKVLKIANHWIYALSTLAVCLVFYVPSIIYSYLTNNCYGLKAYKIAPWGFIYFHSVFVIPVTLCCCYCAYIFIKTYLALRAKKVVYNSSNVQSNSVSLNNHMDLLARRLMSYAIIPLITQFPFVIISELYIDENYVGTVASDCFADILSSSAGWLNFICFMFDPAIPHILYEYELRRSNGSIFQITGNSSDNKPALNGAGWLSSLKLGSDFKRSSTTPLTSITTTSSFTVIDSNDTRFSLSEVEETTAIRIKQM